MIERTFVIIKPDAIWRGLIGQIISRFEGKVLGIKAIAMRQKSKDWCSEHYCHLPSDIYEGMQEYIVNVPLIGIVLEGENAVAVVRKMVGCTNSLNAAPGTIRGDYGTHPIRYNLVHATDSLGYVDYEIELFFNSETDSNE